MKKLVSLEKKITQMLTNNSSLRNDNRKLCVAIWTKEANALSLEYKLLITGVFSIGITYVLYKVYDLFF